MCALHLKSYQLDGKDGVVYVLVPSGSNAGDAVWAVASQVQKRQVVPLRRRNPPPGWRPNTHQPCVKLTLGSVDERRFEVCRG